MTYVVGLTGGIASGKSTVSKYLLNNQIQVVDCDLLAHQSYDYLIDELTLLFPSAIIDGKVNRQILGSIVFNDPKKKEQLEGLIHPWVRKQMELAIQNCKDPMIFLDIPLLYEAHMEDLCDEIWVVYVSYKVQLERLINRNNYSFKEAQNRISKQMSLEEKKKRANVVIENEKGIDDLYENIQKRLEDLNERIITKQLSGL